MSRQRGVGTPDSRSEFLAPEPGEPPGPEFFGCETPEFSIEEEKCGSTKASIHTEEFKKASGSAELGSLMGLNADLEFNQFRNHLLPPQETN